LFSDYGNIIFDLGNNVNIFFLTLVSFFYIIFLKGGTKLNERVIQIRKINSLSQEKFGEKLGITGAAVSRLESGNRQLTEPIIKLLCSTFNINEIWLRTGEGDIFNRIDTDVLAEVAKEFGLDEVDKKIILEYMLLTDEQKEVIKSMCKNISTIFNK